MEQSAGGAFDGDAKPGRDTLPVCAERHVLLLSLTDPVKGPGFSGQGPEEDSVVPTLTLPVKDLSLRCLNILKVRSSSDTLSHSKHAGSLVT